MEKQLCKGNYNSVRKYYNADLAGMLSEEICSKVKTEKIQGAASLEELLRYGRKHSDCYSGRNTNAEWYSCIIFSWQ